MSIISFIEKILDYIYYRKCYICGKKCSDISLCLECKEALFSDLKFHKAEKFNTKIYSATAYENNFLKIIRALKYHQKKEFKNIISEILIKLVEHYNLNIDDYIVCPVPIHKNRLKHRKYNHMELVAQEFANHFSLKMDNSLLSRTKDTPPLYKLSIPQRREYINGAFMASENIANKKIILLDDIVTSGTTIAELSKLILEQKPKDFIVLCASRSNNCNF